MPFNDKLYVFLLVALCSVTSVFCNGCVLKNSEEEINWDMLPGSWYLILNTHDAVEEGVTCYNMRDIKSASDGVYVAFELIRQDGNGTNSCSMFPLHYIRYGAVLIDDPRFEFVWQEDINKHPGNNSKVQVKLEELHLLFSQAETAHTDYVNYLMFTMCAPNGRRYVWVHSRNPYASDADIQRVKDKLASFGNGWNDVPLYPADCRKLTEFDCQIHV